MLYVMSIPVWCRVSIVSKPGIWGYEATENAAKFGVHNVEIVSDLTEEALKDKPVPRLAFLVAQKDTIEQDIVTLKKINPDMKIIIYTLELQIFHIYSRNMELICLK